MIIAIIIGVTAAKISSCAKANCVCSGCATITVIDVCCADISVDKAATRQRLSKKLTSEK